MTGSSTPQVDAIEVAVYQIPTDAPESDGTLAWDSTTFVVVQARAAGTTGIGYTYAGTSAATVVEEKLSGTVEGGDALTPQASWAAMQHAVRNLGRPGVVAEAISAVDVALWDLASRLREVPLTLAIGAVHETMPVYGSGGFTSYDDQQLADQLSGWVEGGIPRVKIKVGRDPDQDEHRLQVARDAIGPDVELFVDANGAYSGKQALRALRDAQDGGADVTWFEEPVPSEDLTGLRLVRQQVDADVAAGEYGSDLVYLRRMCEAGAVDCLQADATRLGGYTEWLRGAAVAASFGLDVSAHCAPNLHAHVATAVPNLRHIEWFHDHVRIERMLFRCALDPRGGTVTPDRARAGHGLTFDDAAAAPYVVRPDGAAP